MSSDASNNWEPPSPKELQAMLPQYEITAIIGRGGMGAVYRARQVNLKRDVAIKLLPESLTQGEDDEFKYAARFEQEAQSMASLDHPGIVHVYDFGETEKGQLYFVMEFINGMDIHQYIRENGGILSQEHALSITTHVLDALEYAHNHGIVHRDIKPANILLNHEGRVKIADFGLAKTFTESADDSAPVLTMTNMALGTPDFVAPEALDSDGTPDHRADLYAVGVMLYRMLTGTLPRGQFKLPSEMNPQLDPRLDEIISQSLQTDPDDRFSSAGIFHQALHPIITSPMTQMEMNAEAEAASQPVKKAKPKTGLYVGIAVAAMIVIGGLSAFFLNQSDSEKVTLTSVGAAEAKPPAIKVPVPTTQPAENPTPVAKAQEQSIAKIAPPQTKVDRTDTEIHSTKNLPDKKLASASSSPAPHKPPESHPSAVAPKTPASPSEPTPLQNTAKPVQGQDGHATENTELLAIPDLKPLLENYLNARRTEVDGLAVKYLGALDGKLNQAADAGDLNLAKSFQGEKKLVETLQKSLATPPADLVAAAAASATLPDIATDAPTGLSGLRKIWTGERQKIQSKLATGIQQSLKTLEGKLTKARDFANAENIQTYRLAFAAANPVAAVAITNAPAKAKPLINAKGLQGISLSVAAASKDKPYENSFGMRFVPISITGGPSDGKLVLFSIWETRVKDYEEFLKKDSNRPWPAPGFKQRNDHPAANVSWDDAVAFCVWLTETDRMKGKLGKDEYYRLPSDHEWSCAVGLGREEDAKVTPSAKSTKIANVYPWGKKFPPPEGAGNYYGEECKRNPLGDRKPMEGYDDGFDRTAPAGSFEMNEYGLYDMGGNVWEWCEDWSSTAKKKRVLRGASWDYYEVSSLRSSRRGSNTPTTRRNHYGFRVVVAGGSGG